MPRVMPVGIKVSASIPLNSPALTTSVMACWPQVALNVRKGDRFRRQGCRWQDTRQHGCGQKGRPVPSGICLCGFISNSLPV